MGIIRTNALGQVSDLSKNQRFRELFDRLKNDGKIYNATDLSVKLEVDKSYISELRNNKRNITEQFVASLVSVFNDVSAEWLLTGEGEMLKTPAPEEKVSEKTLIPFYSNVVSVGGINERVANIDETQIIDVDAQMIDTGDWFRSATAAIVQYGDSMVEYPHGSILAVRRLTDFRNITTGKSYVIETNDYRVTKQLVDVDPEYFIAYSTNKETRPDGSLIHAPFKIYKELIRHIDVVLGCVSIEDAI